MSNKNYEISYVDPETTVGLAIARAIKKAKKTDKKVVICLRDTACVVTKHTELSEGIDRYRRTVERFARVRN